MCGAPHSRFGRCLPPSEVTTSPMSSRSPQRSALAACIFRGRTAVSKLNKSKNVNWQNHSESPCRAQVLLRETWHSAKCVDACREVEVTCLDSISVGGTESPHGATPFNRFALQARTALPQVALDKGVQLKRTNVCACATRATREQRPSARFTAETIYDIYGISMSPCSAHISTTLSRTHTSAQVGPESVTFGPKSTEFCSMSPELGTCHRRAVGAAYSG